MRSFRGVVYVGCVLLLSTRASEAQQVQLTLDLYYSDPEAVTSVGPNPGGYWELIARISDPTAITGESARGIVGVVTRLADICPQSVDPRICGDVALAPQGTTSDAIIGFLDFDVYRDEPTPNWELTFAQLTDLGEFFYDVGLPDGDSYPGENETPLVDGFDHESDPHRNIPWSFDDVLGDLLDDQNPSNDSGSEDGGVRLAAGTFAAGTSPQFLTEEPSSANVFVGLGNAPFGLPLVLQAEVENLVRDNQVTIAGDASLDGRVNAVDLNTLGVAWQQAAFGWHESDFNADGFIDSTDLNAIGINWQRQIPLPAETVPEPKWPPGMLLPFCWLAGRRAVTKISSEIRIPRRGYS